MDERDEPKDAKAPRRIETRPGASGRPAGSAKEVGPGRGRGKKRGRGEGSVFYRKDRRVWVAYTPAVDGREQEFLGNYDTEAAAIQALQGWQAKRATGTLPASGALTVGEHINEWLKLKRRDLDDDTYKSYEGTSRLHIKPYIGNLKLSRLEPLDVERLIARNLEDGKSAHTAGYALTVLRMALKQAVVWQRVFRDPSYGIRKPRWEQRPIEILVHDEVRRLLASMEGHRLLPLVHVDLMTGLREGEILGLRWQDVDLAGRALRVVNQLDEEENGWELRPPKTPAGRREVTLSKDTVEVLEAQRERQRFERGRLGDAWQDLGMVFPSRTGALLLPRTMYAAYKRCVEKAKVTDVTFHALRHTHVSALILVGVDARVIADRVGHTDPAFTMRVYAHVFTQQRRAAAVPFDRLYGPAAEGVAAPAVGAVPFGDLFAPALDASSEAARAAMDGWERPEA